MNEEIELLRDKLEKLILEVDTVTDSEVLKLSQELDELISEFYLCVA